MATRKQKVEKETVEVVAPAEQEVVEAAAAAEEPTVEPAKVEPEVKEADVIGGVEYQLSIYESKVVAVPEHAKRIVVENLGGGDLYVDTIALQYTANYRVSPGDSKEFSKTKNILIGSASRPHVRITFYKR